MHVDVAWDHGPGLGEIWLAKLRAGIINGYDEEQTRVGSETSFTLEHSISTLALLWLAWFLPLMSTEPAAVGKLGVKNWIAVGRKTGFRFAHF